jgi:hypothetical protein
MSNNDELFRAILSGDLHVLQRLIADRGNDPEFYNRKNSNGFTALFRACTDGRADMVQALLNAGADGSIMCGRASALHIAASNGYFDIVKMLVDSGVPLDARIAAPALLLPGSTALQLAAARDHVDIMLLLLSHYAEVESETLHFATYHGRSDAVALLLAVGAQFTPIDGARSAFSVAFQNIGRAGRSVPYDQRAVECATLIVAAGYEPTDDDFKTSDSFNVTTTVETIIGTRRQLALDPMRILAGHRRIVRVQIDLIRRRATEICIALRVLDISALELCEIISAALPLARFVKFHHIWAIVTTVKNKPIKKITHENHSSCKVDSSL